MKEDRSLLAWLVVPLCAVLLLLAVLSWIGFGRWKDSVKRRAAGANIVQLPHIKGVGDAAQPPDKEPLERSGPSEEEINALLDELLRQRTQTVGAIENEAILRFKTKEAYEDFLRRAAALGLRVLAQLDDFRAVRVGYDAIDALRRELVANGESIEDIGANYLFKIPGVPEVEERASAGVAPFGSTLFTALGASGDRSLWGAGVSVAVLDAGLTNHPTFGNNQVTARVDLVRDGQPFNGHGDAMASLIAGSAAGAEGVAPAAKLMDVRIFDAAGEGDSFVLAQGIEYAVDHGASIINISGASYGDSALVRQSIQYALDNGVVIIAPTGNEQAGIKAYPAAYDGVISVSAVSRDNQLAYFSNSGGPTLAAPGVGVPSAYSENGQAGFVYGSGTSQATAIASGAAAYLLGIGQNPANTLQNHTVPGAASTSSHQIGAGVLYLGNK